MRPSVGTRAALDALRASPTGRTSSYTPRVPGSTPKRPSTTLLRSEGASEPEGPGALEGREDGLDERRARRARLERAEARGSRSAW